MARSALHSSPRALGRNRQDLFQNLLLTTLAVVAAVPTKNVDLGRPVGLTQNRQDLTQQPFQLRTLVNASALVTCKIGDDERPNPLKLAKSEIAPRNFQQYAAAASSITVPNDFTRPIGLRVQRDGQFPNLQFLLDQYVVTFASWEDAVPVKTVQRKADPQGLNLPLLSAPLPIGDQEVSGRPVALARGRDAPAGVNVQLFPEILTSPARGRETGGKPVQLYVGRLGDPQGVSPRNLTAAATSVVLNFDLSGRPRQLARGSSDLLGSAYGLLQQVVVTPVVPVDLGRPRRLARTADSAPQGLNLALLSVQLPYGQADFGRPIGNVQRREDPVGINLQRFVQIPTTPVIGLDLSRPAMRQPPERYDFLGSPYGLIEQAPASISITAWLVDMEPVTTILQADSRKGIVDA